MYEGSTAILVGHFAALQSVAVGPRSSRLAKQKSFANWFQKHAKRVQPQKSTHQLVNSSVSTPNTHCTSADWLTVSSPPCRQEHSRGKGTRHARPQDTRTGAAFEWGKTTPVNSTDAGVEQRRISKREKDITACSDSHWTERSEGHHSKDETMATHLLSGTKERGGGERDRGRINRKQTSWN